jgi:hypothetical protein
MAIPRSADYEKSLALLAAALGSFNPKQPLAKILKRVADFGKFEWMLTIIGLEIDLRVDIPESLADGLDRTAEDFAQLVAKLPKIDSPGYTLECLGLVAQALLSLDVGADPAEQPARGQSAHKAPARGARSPRKKASKAKRATKTTDTAKPKSKAKPKPSRARASVR